MESWVGFKLNIKAGNGPYIQPGDRQGNWTEISCLNLRGTDLRCLPTCLGLRADQQEHRGRHQGLVDHRHRLPARDPELWEIQVRRREQERRRRKSHLDAGAQDVIDIIRDANKRFGGGGIIGAKAVVNCAGNVDDTTIEWGIY